MGVRSRAVDEMETLLSRHGQFACSRCGKWIRRVRDTDGASVYVDAAPTPRGDLEIVAWTRGGIFVAPAGQDIGWVRLRRHVCS